MAHHTVAVKRTVIIALHHLPTLLVRFNLAIYKKVLLDTKPLEIRQLKDEHWIGNPAMLYQYTPKYGSQVILCGIQSHENAGIIVIKRVVIGVLCVLLVRRVAVWPPEHAASERIGAGSLDAKGYQFAKVFIFGCASI